MSDQTLVTAPIPPGHFVGLKHWMLEDKSRKDPSTGVRRFMASCWYPAIPNWDKGPVAFADFLEPKVDEALELLSGEANDEEKSAFIEQAKKLTLRSQKDATFEAGQKRPVLIYYPGGLSHRFTNAGLCEQLVVAGYVVIALDAMRDAPVVVFPDGQIVNQVANSNENYIWPRVADVQCLLDELPRLNEEVFGGELDLDRIGMFGHSRGGYLSTICSVKDERIKAAINMDGFAWGLWVKEGTGLQKFPPEFQTAARASKRPLLRLMGDQGGLEKTQSLLEKELPDTGGDFIVVSNHGWDHGSFGQTSFLSGDVKELYKKPMTRVSPENALRLLDLVADFFDVYLRGHTEQPKVTRTKDDGLDVCCRIIPRA